MKKLIAVLFTICTIMYNSICYAEFSYNLNYSYSTNTKNTVKETISNNGYTITTFEAIEIDEIPNVHGTNDDFYIVIIKSPSGKITEIFTNGNTSIKLN